MHFPYSCTISDLPARNPQSEKSPDPPTPSSSSGHESGNTGLKVLPARVLGPKSLLWARDKGILPVSPGAADTITFPQPPQTSLTPPMDSDGTNIKHARLQTGTFFVLDARRALHDNDESFAESDSLSCGRHSKCQRRYIYCRPSAIYRARHKSECASVCRRISSTGTNWIGSTRQQPVSPLLTCRVCSSREQVLNPRVLAPDSVAAARDNGEVEGHTMRARVGLGVAMVRDAEQRLKIIRIVPGFAAHKSQASTRCGRPTQRSNR